MILDRKGGFHRNNRRIFQGVGVFGVAINVGHLQGRYDPFTPVVDRLSQEHNTRCQSEDRQRKQDPEGFGTKIQVVFVSVACQVSRLTERPTAQASVSRHLR